MLECKRCGERTKWRRVSKTVVFLVAALVIIFIPSGVGAQELISLNVNQMDLQDVLRLIAEKADLNIIMGKEVTGTVTLRLKNVDLWQALGTILEVSGFSYREEKGIIRLVKLGEVAGGKPIILTTEVIPLRYAKAEDIRKASQHLLSPSGTMEIDSRSNALIITDSSETIEKIDQLVARLDTGIPVFNLNGILFSPEESLVMINERILRQGERIGDFTVTEIGEDRVTLKRGNEVITLRLREERRALEK